MNVLEKILEEIEKEQNSYEADHAWNYSKGMEYAKEIIRSHMNEREVFKFDFNRVKSFDCQCGRHYVNTYDDDWISVEEGLPKETEKEYYPVMYVTTSYGVVAWGFYRVKDEQWYLYNDIMEEFESVENNKIIAWQPLPEPYKPKETISVAGMDHIMIRFTKVE